MRFSLFWDVTQRLLVVTDVSGQSIGPMFVGCPETSPATNRRCVTSQRSEDIIYTAAEA
jgi:hypothetical protein